MTPATPGPQTPPPGWAAPPEAPAGPAQGLRYAGFWVRFVAFILDAIVLAVLTAALAPLIGGGGGMVDFENGVYNVNYGANAIVLLIDLVYFVGFWTWRGQSPGMIPFNMRIVLAADGGKVDVVRALLRYVGLLISIAVLFLGVIWVAFDRRKQGWHDKIAGTVVVRPT
ncbi:MAG: RDD family protein [Chloroflexota bacterium]